MSSVIVSLRIAASPERVFAAFTQEISAWWRPMAVLALTPRGDGTLRFEPGPEGRLVADLPNGHVFEIGKILAWEPPRRLMFLWRQATFTPDQITTVEVVFEPVGAETRVTVTHSGWDAIPIDHVARHGFPISVLMRRQGEQWRDGLAGMAACMS